MFTTIRVHIPIFVCTHSSSTLDWRECMSHSFWFGVDSQVEKTHSPHMSLHTSTLNTLWKCWMLHEHGWSRAGHRPLEHLPHPSHCHHTHRSTHLHDTPAPSHWRTAHLCAPQPVLYYLVKLKRSVERGVQCMCIKTHICSIHSQNSLCMIPCCGIQESMLYDSVEAHSCVCLYV